MYSFVKSFLLIMMTAIMIFSLGGCDGALDGPTRDTTITPDGTSEEDEISIDIDADADLVVNEIMAKDSDGGPDWIELYAAGDDAVLLSDYSIIDDSGDERASLPNVTLEPGEFYVVQATDQAPEDDSVYVPFKLSDDDAVYLFEDEKDTVVSYLDWESGDAPEGFSYGRIQDGNGDAMTLTPTPGKSNKTDGDEDGDEDNDVETNTGLVVNEIMANDADGGPDWIELYVAGDDAVLLSDYSIIDDSGDERASLPNVTLEPNEFYVIQATDQAPEDDAAYVPFKLGNDDAVYLYENEGNTLVSSLDWESGEAPEGSSYGRLPDGNGDAMTLAPTPGDPNKAQDDADDADDADEDGEDGDSDEDIVRPDGWDDETHGDDADANYRAVFNQVSVHRLDIIIDPEDWQAMMNNMTGMYGEFGGLFLPDDEDGFVPPDGSMFPEENTIYVPCSVNFENKQWLHVGIRFKGQSSLMSTWKAGIYKLPFRLDFDEFEDDYPEIKDQRFYGFQKLSLVNGFSDNSLMRESMAANIFRKAGVPAPRTAFYRLYIDHGDGPIYFGLYTMVEIPDKPMLKAQFSGSGGNLYKPKGSGATFDVYDESSFDKETNEDENDYSDIKALYDALHADRTNAEQWRTGLEATLNVPGFIRWLAVNTVIQNWDTYGLMPQNYYLYNDPETGLLNWIPWDNNMALSDGIPGGALSLELTEVDEHWPLIRFLMDDPVYHAMYVDEVHNVVTNVFRPERMKLIYTLAKLQIKRYVIGDEGELDGYTLLKNKLAFHSAVYALKKHVQSRYDAAMEFVDEN